MRVLISAAITVSLLLTFAAVWAAEEPEMVSVEGEHIILTVRADDLKHLNDPEAWVAKLDQVYEAYADLIGMQPFNGEKLTILSEPERQGVWACYDGTPAIKWGQKYIAKTFESINKGDWCFGILHEIGHVYDVHCRWNWAGEFWANYKMEYVFYKVKPIIFSGDKICDYSDPNCPYKALDHGPYSKLTQEVGWEPLKKTFRWFNTLKPDEEPPDGLAKRSLFIRAIQDYSGVKLTDRTADWADDEWGGILTVDSPDVTAAAKILHKKDWNAAVLKRRVQAAPGEKVTVGACVVQKKDITFKKGLGTHSVSEIVYNLNGKYKTFESYYGIAGREASEGQWGSVTFVVTADGKKLFESPLLKGGGPCRHTKLDITGARELKLIVTDGGDNMWGDWSAWGDAKVADATGNVTYLSDLKPVSYKQGEAGMSIDTTILGIDKLSGNTGPILFCYGPCPQSAKIIGKVDGRTVELHKSASDPEGYTYEYTFDDGFEKGTHVVELFIKVGDAPITQQEVVTVEVK